MHHSSWIFRQRLQLLHLINQGLKAHLFHTETQGGKKQSQNYDKDGRKSPQGGKNAYKNACQIITEHLVLCPKSKK